jgi:hypothetical protein
MRACARPHVVPPFAGEADPWEFIPKGAKTRIVNQERERPSSRLEKTRRWRRILAEASQVTYLSTRSEVSVARQPFDSSNSQRSPGSPSQFGKRFLWNLPWASDPRLAQDACELPTRPAICGGVQASESRENAGRLGEADPRANWQVGVQIGG